MVATDTFTVDVAQPQPPLPIILSFDPNKYEYTYGEDIYFIAVTTAQIADPDVDVVCTNGDYYAYDFTETQDADGNYIYTSGILHLLFGRETPHRGNVKQYFRLMM